MAISPGFKGETPSSQSASQSEQVCLCTVTRSTSVTIKYDPKDMFNYSVFLEVGQRIACLPEGVVTNTITQSNLDDGGVYYSSLRQKQYRNKPCLCPYMLPDGATVTRTETDVASLTKFFQSTAAGKQKREVVFKEGQMFPAEMPEFAREILTSPTQQLTLGVGITYPLDDIIAEYFNSHLENPITDIDSQGFPTENWMNNCKKCCK